MRAYSRRFFLSACLVAGLAATAFSSHGAEKPGEWQVLFDGKHTDHWRAYKGDCLPNSWRLQDGVLKTVVGNGKDIVTKEQYRDFELELEWRVTPGANSGLMYRVTEEFDEPWFTGPEYQILDDSRHPDGKNPKTTAASLYALIAAQNKTLKPVGEWNQTRLLVKGTHVEHWLNGGKVVEYELGSDALKALIAKSKFADKPKFMAQPTGHIVLQHHHDEVWYRNIRVRRL